MKPNYKNIFIFFAVTIAVIVAVIISNLTKQDTEESNTFNLDVKNWAIQLQDADPYEIAQSGFELVVLDYSKDGSEEKKYSSEEIEIIKKSGVIPIAYLSIGEAEDYRFYWKEEWNSSPPKWLGKENPEWKGNYAVRYWESEWKKIIYEYLDKIIEQGFSGVYLDRIDAYEYWSDASNGENLTLSKKDSTKRMIDFIIYIANYCKNKTKGNCYIILQNGEDLIKFDNENYLLKAVSGWSVEDFFYDETEIIPSEIVQERVRFLDIVISEGKPVFSVDYVDNNEGGEENKKRIDDYRAKAIEKGYIPYAAKSDRELDEINIIQGVQP